jgi:pimeloyl-ACP methyl ester carboxylesterase
MGEGGRVQVGDLTLAYSTRGTGPPLILIHGLLGSRRWWARNVEALGRCRCVYAVDLAGFGSNLTWRPFVLDRAIQSLVDFMDALGIDQASVIGHSMGGLVALGMADRLQARIDRLVLVDAAVLAFDSSLPRRISGLVHAIRWMPIDFLPLLAVDAVRAGPVSFASAAYELFSADRRAELGRIDQPALIVWGEHDTIVPLEIAIALSRALRNARLAIVEGAGHSPMWEQPARFNQLVTEFLHDSTPDDRETGGAG